MDCNHAAVVRSICNRGKNGTTGADASGKYKLAGIHKFINALTTHSELLSHPRTHPVQQNRGFSSRYVCVKFWLKRVNWLPFWWPRTHYGDWGNIVKALLIYALHRQLLHAICICCQTCQQVYSIQLISAHFEFAWPWACVREWCVPCVRGANHIVFQFYSLDHARTARTRTHAHSWSRKFEASWNQLYKNAARAAI